MSSQSSVVTSCTWKFLLYPESMNPKAFAILESTRFHVAISPLHALDVWSEDDEEVINGDHAVGEIKKPHYHIVLHSDSTKSYNQMLEIARQLAKDPQHPVYPKRGGDLRQAIRYLTHEDHIGVKAHYDPAQVRCLNGFDISRFYLASADEDDFLSQSIEDLIYDQHLYEYAHLMRALRSTESLNGVPASDFYRYAKRHTIYFNAILHSLRNSSKPSSSDS